MVDPAGGSSCPRAVPSVQVTEEKLGSDWGCRLQRWVGRASDSIRVWKGLGPDPLYRRLKSSRFFWKSGELAVGAWRTEVAPRWHLSRFFFFSPSLFKNKTSFCSENKKKNT